MKTLDNVNALHYTNIMLDKRTLKLLIYVTRICEDGSFKVIENEDLARAVSSKADLETIRPILKYLRDSEMIDIKYSDENKYCLSVLPKGRVYIETYHEKRREIAVSYRMALFIIAGSFVAAFAATFLAGAITKLLGW